MPTGYTAFIEDGEITNVKDFILLCTRAFGVALEIRDEPLSVPTPIEFKPAIKWETKKLNEFKTEMEHLLTISDEDFHNEITKRNNEELQKAKQRYEEQCQLNDIYTKMLEQVERWNPPENCEDLKAFVIEQLQISKPDLTFYKDILDRAESKCTISDAEHKKTMIAECSAYIVTFQNAIDRNIKKAEEKTKFMKDLIESLKQLE